MKLVNKNYDHFVGEKRSWIGKIFKMTLQLGMGSVERSQKISQEKPRRGSSRNQRPFAHLVKTRGTWICYLDREAQLDVDPLELLLLLVWLPDRDTLFFLFLLLFRLPLCEVEWAGEWCSLGFSNSSCEDWSTIFALPWNPPLWMKLLYS